MRRFPKVLAIVAHPDLPGLLVDAHAPRVTQAIGPVFRARIGHSYKWVVLGHGVRLRSVRVIDVDAQHAAEKLAQILAAVPPIRIARAVAGRDVKHPVVAEDDAAAVMSLRVPLDDRALRLPITRERRLARDGESRDPVGAFRFGSCTVAENVKEAVGAVARMERCAIDQTIAHLEKSFDLIGVRVVG